MAHNWWDITRVNWRTYLRSCGEGVGFPSRKWLARHLSPTQSILDVGCGGGIEYESLLRKHPNIIYTGVDYSHKAIAACRRMFPEGAFVVGDARNLKKFPDESFDTVLLRHIIDYTDNYEAVLRAAWRVAKKEVIIIVRAPMYEDDREHFLRDNGYDCYYRIYSEPKLRKWIKTELKPKSYKRKVITAENVPDRDYRVDTILLLNKPKK